MIHCNSVLFPLIFLKERQNSKKHTSSTWVNSNDSPITLSRINHSTKASSWQGLKQIHSIIILWNTDNEDPQTGLIERKTVLEIRNVQMPLIQVVQPQILKAKGKFWKKTHYWNEPSKNRMVRAKHKKQTQQLGSFQNRNFQKSWKQKTSE